MKDLNQSNYDILVIASCMDFSLLSELSKSFSIVYCERVAFEDSLYYKVVDCTKKESFKLIYDLSLGEYLLAKMVSRDLEHELGFPKVIWVESDCYPISIVSYFSSVYGSEVILDYVSDQKLDAKFSWVSGASRLTLVRDKEQAEKYIVSQLNPIKVIPEFTNQREKLDFYKTTLQFVLTSFRSYDVSDLAKKFSESLMHHQDLKNLLIISYCSMIGGGLGSVRPGYWYDQLPSEANGKINTYFLSPLCNRIDPNQIEIKDQNMFSFKGPDDWEWFDGKLKSPVSIQAATWTLSVVKFLSMLPDNLLDKIIITGNPFFLFYIPKLLSLKGKKFKFILDYRDPFAENTRFRYSEFQRDQARNIEALWNTSVEKVVTVNEECAKLVIGKSNQDTVVVPNGYDERLLKLHVNESSAKVDQKSLKLVYAGSVYSDRNLDELLAALEGTSHMLHLVGKVAPGSEEIFRSPNLTYHGFLPYEETLEIISESDIAVLLLSGCHFVSTTKIYDYIALNKYVLGLSPDVSNEINFRNEFKSYPNAKLIGNFTEEIRRFLVELNLEDLQEVDENIRLSFSRRASLGPLLQLL